MGAIPRNKPTRSVISPDQHLVLFGPPQVLEGEDSAAYDALYASVCAAIKPRDVIEEILVNDLISREWELVRLRRLKTTLLKTWTSDKLEDFLADVVNLEHYGKALESEVADILGEHVPKERAEELARTYARSSVSSADEEVNGLLSANGHSVEEIQQRLRTEKAKQLTRAIALRERSAVKLVNRLLASEGKTFDCLTVDALTDYDRLTTLERMDRLTTIAELRREAALKELDRHRAVLGEAARRIVQDVEDGEFKVIETPVKGRAAS